MRRPYACNFTVEVDSDSTIINPFGLGFFEASRNEKTSLQTINLQTRVGGATKVI